MIHPCEQSPDTPPDSGPSGDDRPMRKPIRVILFQRKRHSVGNFSFEKLYPRILRELPPDIDASLKVARSESKGIWRRAAIALEASLLRADIVHVTGDIHFAAIVVPGRRVLLTIHDLTFLERVRGKFGTVMRVLWLMLPAMRASLISTVSEASRQRILSELPWLDPGKVRVVHNFVEECFTGAANDSIGDPPRILAVGSAPNKNLTRLAAALEGIACKLVVLGSPSAEVSDAARRAGVEMETHRNLTEEEVIALYRSCDLLAYPSTEEGFGIPILEAQSIGRPVVTSNRSSMPEVAGDSACLVDPFDVSSIRAGILRVLTDSGYREDLVRKGKANVLRFDARKTAEGYAALYRELAGR